MPSFEKRQKPKVQKGGGGRGLDIKDRRDEIPNAEETLNEINEALKQSEKEEEEVDGCVCFGGELNDWNPFG